MLDLTLVWRGAPGKSKRSRFPWTHPSALGCIPRRGNRATVMWNKRLDTFQKSSSIMQYLPAICACQIHLKVRFETDSEVVPSLTKSSKSTKSTRSVSWTPCTVTSCRESCPANGCVAELLDAAADVGARDNQGRLALDLLPIDLWQIIALSWGPHGVVIALSCLTMRNGSQH